MKTIGHLIRLFTPRLSTPGQRVRIACTIMGVVGAVFAYQSTFLFIAVLEKLDISHQSPSYMVVNFTVGSFISNSVVTAITFGIMCLCGLYIKKKDAPGPDGWGQPIIKKSEVLEHPDLVWAVRKIWESGYFREGETVYFTTVRDILNRAGIKTSATQVRSVIQMAGCSVKRDTVQESDLATMFRDMDAEVSKENNVKEQTCQ